MPRILISLLTMLFAIFSSATIADETFDTRALMRATGLDEVFDRMDTGVTESLIASPLATDPRTVAAIGKSAREAFVASQMHDRLATALEGKFTPPELAELQAFYTDTVGIEVTELERAALRLDHEGYLAAVREGDEIFSQIAPERIAQYDAMQELLSEGLQEAMLRHTIRAVITSLVVGTSGGDIAVPWDAIDAQVEQVMPAAIAEQQLSQRRMSSYMYRDVSDDDLQAYIDFLRTDTARRFYEVAVTAIVLINADAMQAFGEALGREMRAVGV